MSFFRRTRREVPLLNTAALPDLIFTVLFFFITVTHMRQVTLKVKYRVPEGTELTRLVKKSAVIYIYIGKPTDEMSRVVGGDTRIQVNDKYVDADEVADYVASERDRMSPEDAQAMSISVKADRETEMGVISDVRHALMRVGALRVNYSAVQKGEK